MVTYDEIVKMIDHSLLRPEFTGREAGLHAFRVHRHRGHTGEVEINVWSVYP